MTLTHKELNIERTKDMIKVMQAYVDGADIEVGEVIQNVTLEIPLWNWSRLTYRVVEKTPDSINWDHVAPEYKWMARDENGRAFLYDEKPYRNNNDWSCVNVIINVKYFSSYKRGTCDWKDSLVQRPE